MMLEPGGGLVLVVDDFDDGREMLAECLEAAGFRVAQAVNGEEAIAQARALVPDLILMDLTLPVLDGLEATRRLKADALTASIPVLAISGALASHAEVARAAGCVALVTKPYVPDDVVREIRAVLAGRS